MSDTLIFVLICLAAFRLTRLITLDYFPPVRILREKIEDYFGDEHWLTYLTQCSWCAGVWVAGLVNLVLALVVANILHQSWWPWPIWALMVPATATVVGLMATWLEKDDEEQD